MTTPVNSIKQISIFDLAEFIFVHLDNSQEETINLIREFVRQKYSVGIQWDEAELREVLYGS